MKKIILIIVVLFAFNSKAQTNLDSTEITITIQAKDVEYISAFIFYNDFYENLADSIKPTYRKLVNPTNTTPIKITGYTKDFIEVLKMLRNDVVAVKNNVDSRLTSLLSALNSTYINSKLTEFTDSDNIQYNYYRSNGKYRLTKKRN